MRVIMSTQYGFDLIRNKSKKRAIDHAMDEYIGYMLQDLLPFFRIE